MTLEQLLEQRARQVRYLILRDRADFTRTLTERTAVTPTAAPQPPVPLPSVEIG